MRTTAARLTVLAASLCLVAGCGDDGYPSYSQSKACSVPVEKVVDVVGTDHFHTRTKGGRLPLGSSPTFSCDVDVADRRDVLSVTVSVSSPSAQADWQRSIDATDEQFEAAGGPAGIQQDSDGFKAWWQCPGRTTGYLTGSPDEQPGTRDLKVLVTAVADAAGCGG